MKLQILVSGLAITATGAVAFPLLEKQVATGFLQGALQLGGGLLICWAFSLRMHWHGVIGAGILALLGTARGLGNLPGVAKFLMGDRPRGVAPLLELGVLLISLLLLVRVLQALSRERVRRMLEQE